MKRWFASLSLALILSLAMGTARAQEGEILFEETFQTTRLDLVFYDEDRYFEPEIIREDGETFAQLQVTDYAYIEPEMLEMWGDYRLEITARIENGTFYITGRSGADGSCEGYDLVYPTSGEIFFSRINADCDYDLDIGEYRDSSLAEGEWVTFAMELVGDQFTVFVNNEEVISGSDDSFAEGDLLLYFSAENSRGGTLDLQSVRVTSLGTQTAAGGTRTGGRTGETTTSAEVRVDDYTGEPADVVAELAAQGVVEEGGYFLFGEDFAWFAGNGNWFTPLARQQLRQDIVMGGELTFTYGESDEFQACGLMARVNTDANGSTTTQTEFGVTSSGEAYLFDADFNNDLFDAYSERVRFSSGDSAHVILVLESGLATLFVDGERVMDRVKVDTRSGSFGIGLLSRTSEARCEGRDIWVWTWE